MQLRIILALGFAGLPLSACQIVAGPRLRGAELAAVSPAFASLDGALDLGPAPMVGIPRVFHVAELVRLGQRAGIPLPAPLADVCFERATQTLDAEALMPVLNIALANPGALTNPGALAHPGATIEILDYSRAKVAPGKLEFTRAALEPSGMWRGRVADPQGRSTPVWVRVRVSDSMTGEVLKLSPAAAPREVERGDRVRVEVASGGVLLAFDAAAETAGRAGEWVLVKNAATGRRFRARVESKGKVSIRK